MTIPQLDKYFPRSLLRSLALGFPMRWDVRRGYRLPSASLGPYFIEWLSDSSAYGEDWDTAPRDARGVILTHHFDHYHPVRIAQFGLHNHARWLSGGSLEARSAFLAQAEWLRRSQHERSGVGGCYVYDFPHPHYGAQPNWISAMAQGEAISLLLRAEHATGESAFRNAAIYAAEPFRREVREGGVVWRSAEGDAFLEEVATLPCGHILNGNMFALWGLIELGARAPTAWLGDLIAAATQTLRRRLPLFDSGYWSYYDLLATPRGFRSVAVLKYHAFHIAQLRVTTALTGDSFFANVADRWEGYVRLPSSRARVIANRVARLVPRFITRADSIPGGAVVLL